MEDGPEQDINCRACTRMRKSPVCGNDGRTYPSRCFAVNCRGLGDGEIVDGRCSALVSLMSITLVILLWFLILSGCV